MTTNLNFKRIAVLGAGLQGACIAMELAARGAHVDLYERNSVCVAEASAHNEGKVHLGYTYAHDKSFRTARLMVDGALCFERLLRRWVGDGVANLPTSLPFDYVVHRRGLITADDFAHHAGKLAGWIANKCAGNAACYFGRDLLRAPERICDDELSQVYSPTTAAAAFRTEEISIDPEVLARLIRLRLTSEPGIRCLTQRTVIAVEESGKELLVMSRQDGCEDRQSYAYVVNTLWSDRLSIDNHLGLLPDRAWSFRFKYFVRATTPSTANVPSVTIVLGPFGDIVNYGNGTICLSWYPIGMTTWSTAIKPPLRPPVLEGAAAASIQSGILQGLANVIPEAANIVTNHTHVKGGWIFGWGTTDIDDPRSELHERFAIGVRRHGPYLTVDTGKLTLAPMFAERAVKMLME